MGSTRSGRRGIDFADFQRAERLCRAGMPNAEIAGQIGIEPKTVLAIASGRHPFQQADGKYRRCPSCGAMGLRERRCGCSEPEPPARSDDAILAELRRYVLPDGCPTAAIRPRKLPDRWLLGQLLGRPGVGKTRLARSWWPGGTIPQPPPRDVVGIWLCQAWPSGTAAAIAASCRLAGLGQSLVARTVGELAQSELERLAVARAVLADRSVAIIDPFLPALEPADRDRIARRIQCSLAAGELRPRRVVLVGGTQRLTAADFCFELRASGQLLARTGARRRDRRRAYRAVARETGRCLDCSRPAATGRVRCDYHLAAQRCS